MECSPSSGPERADTPRCLKGAKPRAPHPAKKKCVCVWGGGGKGSLGQCRRRTVLAVHKVILHPHAVAGYALWGVSDMLGDGVVVASQGLGTIHVDYCAIKAVNKNPLHVGIGQVATVHSLGNRDQHSTKYTANGEQQVDRRPLVLLQPPPPRPPAPTHPPRPLSPYPAPHSPTPPHIPYPAPHPPILLRQPTPAPFAASLHCMPRLGTDPAYPPKRRQETEQQEWKRSGGERVGGGGEGGLHPTTGHPDTYHDSAWRNPTPYKHTHDMVLSWCLCGSCP